MAIRNSNVPRPPFFVSKTTFEALVAPQIRRMLPFALECLNNVHQELIDTCLDSLPEEVDRFPYLKQEIMKLVKQMVQNNVEKASEMVSLAKSPGL